MARDTGRRKHLFLYIKAKKTSAFAEVVVPGAGLEPARGFPRGILSPLRLPVSPPGLSNRIKNVDFLREFEF